MNKELDQPAVGWGVWVKRAASVGLATVIVIFAVLGTFLGALYFLIRFIHWAWIR
jgi:hypothetical protein